STGIHSNGYSLVRKVLLEKAGMKLEHHINELGRSLGEELITPTRIYVKTALAVIEEVSIKAMAHITGGGIPENLPRVLPPGLGAEIKSNTWEPPAIFQLIQQLGRVEKNEMYRTFNMGIGYIFITSPEQSDEALKCLRIKGEKPIVLGNVSPESAGVSII
ncbi:MAG: phosphoribosylformylglycinamidine cyclo-ligase, partial [Deltaproteobacteria bacterium]